MHGLLGLVGTVVVFAGLHLLWQARYEIFFWLEAWFQIFRAALRQPGARPQPLPASGPKGRNVVRMLLGMGLVFFLGPALIVLGLNL